MKQLKTDKQAFMKNQKKCFTRLMKFQQGMINLMCRSDYASFVKTTGSTTEVQVKQSTCTNLKADCFDYVSNVTTIGYKARAELADKDTKTYKNDPKLKELLDK